ncbi:hypothetical protein CHARACLAT_010901 [Characodon lateralis]|uniref:Uncharacterized protein n=1 Tax=Characodon lateralis TaxID=208331 RepID=A0ABU7CX58_9TELE|nr:hypothetical protein [Characodon lateralis]
MAVFFHPKQSGQYTVWVIERDKPPVAFFSTDTLPHITGEWRDGSSQGSLPGQSLHPSLAWIVYTPLNAR